VEREPTCQAGLPFFGEMVAILWSEGNKVGALELERLWNDVLKDHAFAPSLRISTLDPAGRL